MTTQLGFRLPAPAVSEADVRELCAVLAMHNWRTAAELAGIGYDDRRLRAIAEASNGAIISGQRGYALLSQCTPDEIDHAASWLESQAKKMLARAAAIRRRFHAYGHNHAQPIA